MKLWSWITLTGLIALCAVNLITMARRVPPRPRAPLEVPSNVVVRHDQRMAAVRSSLQKHDAKGIIGYIADVEAAGLASHPRGMEYYMLTQFALVPWVLDLTLQGCEWVVLDLHTTAISARVPPGYRVVEDFGHGVGLVRKAGATSP